MACPRAEGELPYALAPFIDLDGDQRYDPLEDYPAYDLDRQFDCRRKETDVLYGDQTIWWVYNDRGNIHTETSAGALGLKFVPKHLRLPRTTKSTT